MYDAKTPLELPVHPTTPPFESKVVETLYLGRNVLALRGEDTFKYHTTDLSPTDTDLQELRVFMSEDSKGRFHYLLITTTHIQDDLFKEFIDVMIITPLVVILPEDITVTGLSAVVNHRVFEKYKKFIHRVDKPMLGRN